MANINELLDGHVTLEVECLDRLYLNGYIERLIWGGQLRCYLKEQVNHYYCYLDDADFGPGFLKICSYAPWGIRLCLNGHEWAKRQLEKKKINFETLDNGFRSCADPKQLQQMCNELGPTQIEGMFRKWLDRLPLPLSQKDREAGYDS